LILGSTIGYLLLFFVFSAKIDQKHHPVAWLWGATTNQHPSLCFSCVYPAYFRDRYRNRTGKVL